jgi:glycosyltransferase involved in cell wall biosynthesis
MAEPDTRISENIAQPRAKKAAPGPGKPRLVIATDNFLPRWDGIARFLAEIIPRLLDEYEITVISPDYGRSTLDAKVARVLIPLRKKKYGDYTPAQFKPAMVKAAIKDADIVFTQTIGPVGLLAHRYARKLHKPLVAYIHSIEWELAPRALEATMLKRISYPLAKALTKYLYNRCTLLIVPSENVADMFTWQRIETPKRIVHLGVDEKRFVKGDKALAKQRFNIPKDALVVGFHGRLGFEKNLLTLSRAYIRLHAPEKRLLIVGDGVESLRKRLARVKGSLLPGAQNDVVSYLQAMDIYVMPSFTETTSLAVLEAMSCELPVISSPVGFIQQYIKENENGYFYETKNPFELARKLQALADSKDARLRIGTNARRTVVEQFNWDKTADGIAETLRGLLK